MLPELFAESAEAGCDGFATSLPALDEISLDRKAAFRPTRIPKPKHRADRVKQSAKIPNMPGRSVARREERASAALGPAVFGRTRGGADVGGALASCESGIGDSLNGAGSKRAKNYASPALLVIRVWVRKVRVPFSENRLPGRQLYRNLGDFLPSRSRSSCPCGLERSRR